MIRITVGVRGQTPIDVVPFLFEDGINAIAQEFERSAFVRSVSDIRLKLSNTDGVMSGLFATGKSGVRYQVRVYVNDTASAFVTSPGARQIFVGEISNRTIVFDPAGRFVTFTVFSNDKLFWDRAKGTKILTADVLVRDDWSIASVYKNIIFMLRNNLNRLDKDFNEIFQGDLFQEFDIDAELGLSPVRFYLPDAAAGNDGLYRNLDPNTTVNDLLLAVIKYFNCQIFINPVTENLVVQPRLLVINDVQTPLAGITCDYVAPQVHYSDQDKYDYINAMALLQDAARPILVEVRREDSTMYAVGTLPSPNPYFWSGPIAGLSDDVNPHPSLAFTYYLTEIVEGIESAPSEPLVVEVPHAYPAVAGTLAYPYQPRLRIPPGTPGATKRILYRTKYDDVFAYKLTEWVDNIEQVYVDKTSWYQVDVATLTAMPIGAGRVFTGWFRYDEETGIWDEPILDNQNGENAPAGRVFDITPRLTFLTQNGQSAGRTDDPYQIFCLFGRNRSFSSIARRWQTLMMTLRKVTVKVIGMNFCVGDSVVLDTELIRGTVPVGQTTFVKNANIDIIKEESTLEILAL